MLLTRLRHAGGRWSATMTAQVTHLRLSTVAPSPAPAPKGIGRPCGTPITTLGGVVDAARRVVRRAHSRAHLARRRRARGRRRRHRSRDGRVRQPRHDRDPAPARAPRDRPLTVRGRARLGIPLPRHPERWPPRRRAACDQRHRHRALGSLRQAARRSRLRAPRRQDALVVDRVRELALRDRGSRCARERGCRMDGAGLQRRQAAPPERAAGGQGGHPEERRARANRGRCGRPRTST